MINFNVEIVGTALNDMGLSAHNAISGTGLNTFGFIWDESAIWTKSDANITTNWSWADSSLSTTWTLAE